MAFKFGGKEMYLIFAFAKCCWSTDSRVVRLGKHAHSKQRKTLPHKLCSYTSSLCRCPGSSASIVYFFNIWFGTVQHQKQFGCREGRKIDENIPILQS